LAAAMRAGVQYASTLALAFAAFEGDATAGGGS
jgi:hypothetical protein